MKKVVALLSVLTLFVACQNTSDKQAPASQAYGHAVVVEEVVQANAYTYLNVSENGQSFWIAVTKGDFSKVKNYFMRPAWK